MGPRSNPAQKSSYFFHEKLRSFIFSQSTTQKNQSTIAFFLGDCHFKDGCPSKTRATQEYFWLVFKLQEQMIDKGLSLSCNFQGGRSKSSARSFRLSEVQLIKRINIDSWVVFGNDITIVSTCSSMTSITVKVYYYRFRLVSLLQLIVINLIALIAEGAVQRVILQKYFFSGGLILFGGMNGLIVLISLLFGYAGEKLVRILY